MRTTEKVMGATDWIPKYYGHRIKYRLQSQKVRQACIDHNWYTAGDNEAYGHMLNTLCQQASDLTKISIVAMDIVEHSDPDMVWEMERQCGKAAFKCVMDYLLNDCTWFTAT